MPDDATAAAYVCKACDVEGLDPETAPWHVSCWNCGAAAVITARFVLAAGYYRLLTLTAR